MPENNKQEESLRNLFYTTLHMRLGAPEKKLSLDVEVAAAAQISVENSIISGKARSWIAGIGDALLTKQKEKKLSQSEVNALRIIREVDKKSLKL
jgi:hypothetical protein